MNTNATPKTQFLADAKLETIERGLETSWAQREIRNLVWQVNTTVTWIGHRVANVQQVIFLVA